VNKSSAIFKIEKEKYALEKIDSKRVLKKEVLIKAIQEKRNPGPKIRYKLREILLHSININPSEIPDYIKTAKETAKKNITNIEIIEDISFSECLPIFHKVNNCFVILEEMVLVLNEKETMTPVSILRKDSTKETNKKKTKKVRISPDTPIKESKSKTEKARIKDIKTDQ
jgi:hypothetical protein